MVAFLPVAEPGPVSPLADDMAAEDWIESLPIEPHLPDLSLLLARREIQRLAGRDELFRAYITQEELFSDVWEALLGELARGRRGHF